MKEQMTSHTASLPRRLEYGAVPLDAWKALDPIDPEILAQRERRSYKLKAWVLRHVSNWQEPRQLPYTSASIQRITDKSHEAVFDALEHGWVDLSANDEAPERAAALAKLVERSLYDSHAQRVDRNSCYVELDDTDIRVQHAKAGLATPAELLEILRDYPEIGSIELAKLSHPFDGDATFPMDDDVYKAVSDQLGDLRPAAPVFKTKTMAPDIPALTTLQKRTIGEYETENGVLHVVQRRAFLVRGDEEAQKELGDPYLGRKVRNQTRHATDLFPLIEENLYATESVPYTKWLQPLATSYYVKNLSTVVKHRSAR